MTFLWPEIFTWTSRRLVESLDLLKRNFALVPSVTLRSTVLTDTRGRTSNATLTDAVDSSGSPSPWPLPRRVKVNTSPLAGTVSGVTKEGLDVSPPLSLRPGTGLSRPSATDQA